MRFDEAMSRSPPMSAPPTATDFLRGVRRLLVVGPSGAGKSRLAQRLGERLGLPVVHLDVHYYEPGWRPVSPDVFEARLAALTATDAWIIEGDFSDHLHSRLERAEALIELAFAPLGCIRRVLARAIRDRHARRADLPAGCTESLDPGCLMDICSWRRRARPRLRHMLRSHPQVRVASFADRGALGAWLG